MNGKQVFYVLSSQQHKTTILNNTVLRMLVLDIHRVQKTDRIKAVFKSLQTTMAMIASGCTCLIQLLGVNPAADNHYQKDFVKWAEGIRSKCYC